MSEFIYFGDAVKALDDNGKVGGYLVRFSDGKQKDMSGEYFTSKSFLGSHDGDGVDTFFHHGQPLPVKTRLSADHAQAMANFRDHVFPAVKTKRDAIGIWAETVLDMADEYEQVVFRMAKSGKLGWSSGAVSHLVKVAPDGQILRWPIGEASLTPTPCEPLNRAVALKSLDSIAFADLDDEPDPQPSPAAPSALAAKLNQLIDDQSDDKDRPRPAILAAMAKEAGLDVKAVDVILSGAEPPTDARLKAFARVLNVSFDALKALTRRDHLRTIKGMFEEALAMETPSRWDLENVYACVISKLATAAQAAEIAGVKFDLEAKIVEATAEYTARLQAHALAQVADWMAGDADEEFYLKAILDAQQSAKSLAGADLDTHSQYTVDVLRGIAARFRGNHEGRVKAGRVLSEKNRQRIADLMGQMKTVADDLQKLLDDSMPMASDAEKRAVLTNHLARKHKQRLQLMGV